MEFLHRDNANELATIAEETGAEVLRGPLRYPSETGGWQLGDLDLSAHLSQYRDHEITIIIAATGKAELRVPLPDPQALGRWLDQLTAAIGAFTRK